MSAPDDLHGRIVKAAARAGVQYVMPNIFGGDAMAERAGEEEIMGNVYQRRIKDVQEAGLSVSLTTYYPVPTTAPPQQTYSSAVDAST